MIRASRELLSKEVKGCDVGRVPAGNRERFSASFFRFPSGLREYN